MRVYTKTGDFGETSGVNGQKMSKNSVLIHFIGTADELNSHLGLVKTLLTNEDTRRFIENIQKNLIKLMAHASDVSDEKYLFSEEEVNVLEKEIDRLSEKINEKLKFVLPGKNATEAQIHIARTVARRAERLFAAAGEEQPLCPQAGAYLNRLSDYLFVLSRQV